MIAPPGTLPATQVAAVRVGRRSTVALALVSVVGLTAFGWPLLVTPASGLAHASDAPLVFALLLPLLVAVVLAELADGGMDAKAVAMLGVLSAVAAAIRPLGAGTAGIEPIFFLLVLGGRVFGPGFGFTLGATSLFASALLTGGVGPWLPFQVLGAAWLGLGAGLLPRLRGRRELALLAGYTAVASLAYGALMNLSFWPFRVGAGTALSFLPGASAMENLQRFAIFTVTTSLGWDLGRALTNVALVLITGPAVLAALRRAARRAAFVAPVVFTSAQPTGWAGGPRGPDAPDGSGGGARGPR